MKAHWKKPVSIKQHINTSRAITGLLEGINGLGVILGGLVAIGVLIQGGAYSIPAFLLCLVGTFVWFFLNKLAYIGLQLLTDITELLSKDQTS